MQVIKKISFFLIVFLFFSCYQKPDPKQETQSFKKGEGLVVAFYNVENLFDTYDDPHCNDNEFTPKGHNKWTKDKYRTKQEHISEVIAALGDGQGADIIGLAEIENKAVLDDLILQEKIKAFNYGVVHYNSPDPRGIDVALLYKQEQFTIFFSEHYRVPTSDNVKLHTRDVLLVGLARGKDTLFVFVHHWPSRMYGEEKSEIKRIHVAKYSRELADSLLEKHPEANILLMGDFNDEPSNHSIQQHLGAGEQTNSYLYNPFFKMDVAGEGSHKYKSDWFMFDQIMMNKNLFDKSGIRYKENSAEIFHPEWMHVNGDPEKGPFKTNQGAKYYGGYSDHFPVRVRLVN